MQRPAMQVARRVSSSIASQSDLCSAFCSLYIASRGLCTTTPRRATPNFHNSQLKAPAQTIVKTGDDAATPGALFDTRKKPEWLRKSPEDHAAEAAQRAKEKMKEQRERLQATQRLGGLADNSLFADDATTSRSLTEQETQVEAQSAEETTLAQRSTVNMTLALNPRPNARARWQRKMLIKHLRHRGRLTRQMKVERSERSHLAKSSFFKTSMKKLAPLARQIAGKSIDEAILQMRFSNKKAAKEVRKHLVQARDEAVVMRGMGLGASGDAQTGNTVVTENLIIADPGITPPAVHQNPTKSNKDGYKKSETEIYIAQAWVNRGPYGMQPECRARGRVNMLRPPHTGLSVLLKEEKTRTREKSDKEAKAIRKRLGKNMWTQLPDRPVTKQSQYVLW